MFFEKVIAFVGAKGCDVAMLQQFFFLSCWVGWCCCNIATTFFFVSFCLLVLFMFFQKNSIHFVAILELCDAIAVCRRYWLYYLQKERL